VNQQHVEKRRQTQAQGAVANKSWESFAIKGAGHEVAGDQEQKSHKESLQEDLVSRENRHHCHPWLGVFHEIPAPGGGCK
jgi:hypothetical protein